MPPSKRHLLAPAHPWPLPRSPRRAPSLRPANDTEADLPLDLPEPVESGPRSGLREMRLSPSEERLAEELLEAFMAKLQGG